MQEGASKESAIIVVYVATRVLIAVQSKRTRVGPMAQSKSKVKQSSMENVFAVRKKDTGHHNVDKRKRIVK